MEKDENKEGRKIKGKINIRQNENIKNKLILDWNKENCLPSLLPRDKVKNDVPLEENLHAILFT